MNTIKENLKMQARDIRTLKDQVRDGMRKGDYVWRLQGDLENAKREYRYDHVAYCMLRGRTYEEIENKVRPGNEILMDNVVKIMEKMKSDILARNPEKEVEHA